MRVLWNEPETTNGAIINYTVQVQKYQPVSGSSTELELVTINPEFKHNIPVAMLTRLNNGTFMINISEGLGETMKWDSCRQWTDATLFVDTVKSIMIGRSFDFKSCKLLVLMIIFSQTRLFLIMSLLWQLTLLVLENRKWRISLQEKEVCFQQHKVHACRLSYCCHVTCVLYSWNWAKAWLH